MSMNFAREQSLLRQKLQAKASPELAATRRQQLGSDTVSFLGADDAALVQATTDLATAWPAMGRAQMTAFVRTLWNSKIHELRDVGVRLLAARAALLEPADLPLLEGFLQDQVLDPVHATLARDVVGVVVGKNKKLWKDLKRYADSATDGLRRAAVRASAVPLAGDDEGFARFVELVTPLLAHADALLQAAIDATLGAAAATHGDAVRAFAAQHGRSVVIPKADPKPLPPAPAAAPTPPATKAAPVAKAPKQVVPAVKKPAVAKKPASKPKLAKPMPRKPAPKKAAAKPPKKSGAKGRAR
jgi:hypothetical protein